MKANELMIVDCVKYNNTTCKVYSIESPFECQNEKFNNQYTITLWCNGFIYAVEDEIEPIPLTEEILKANGFIFPIKYEDREVVVYDNLQFLHFFTGGHYVISICGRLTKISYVHELQHALRLCGLNNLADNFKIE